MIGPIVLAAYIAAIPAANYLIQHVGTVCLPDGPCLLPVWPGILAPSGVILAGLALVLRDLVQRTMGLNWSVAAIGVGAALSALLAPPALVAASTASFLLSELADLLVYTPLQKRGLVRAVVASSVIGLAIDSSVFLWLAFGSLAHIEGQIIGKLWMVALAAITLRLLCPPTRTAKVAA